MGKYVENNLGRDEKIVKKAELNGLFLLGTWLVGILFCWLLLIPTIKAIINTIKFNHVELAVTIRRVVGKVGVFNTQTLDAPLDKVQNVSVTQTLGGKIFNYSTVRIDTAASQFEFPAIVRANEFKGALMNQIDQAQEEKLAKQAQQMAQAMAGAINR